MKRSKMKIETVVSLDITEKNYLTVSGELEAAVKKAGGEVRIIGKVVVLVVTTS